MLRSLTKDFDYVVAAIEESKDLSKYGFDKLMGSLLAHEARISRSYEKVDEKAFQVKGETQVDTSRGRGKGGCRDRGHGRSQGRGHGRGGSNEERQIKSSFHCHYCKKLGHKAAYCWQKQKDEANQANFAEKTEDSKLFMAFFFFLK